MKMKNGSNRKVDYGNWVSTKLIVTTAGLACFFWLLHFGLGRIHLLKPLPYLMVEVPKMFCYLSFILCSAGCLYFGVARLLFSEKGGKIQGKIVGLLVDHIAWNGKGRVVDIGCGNGYLAVLLAKKYPGAVIMALDYWKGLWGYSQEQSEANAKSEGVGGRITFRRAGAARLPFEDGTFDLAVSNLVFHEVSQVGDKKELIKEALRVVKKGGAFVFQDLFLARNDYGRKEQLMETIKSWGVEKVYFVDTSKSKFIPFWLRLPFMVGTIALIYGVK
jgi:SAM-dependent methyltransferase